MDKVFSLKICCLKIIEHQSDFGILRHFSVAEQEHCTAQLMVSFCILRHFSVAEQEHCTAQLMVSFCNLHAFAYMVYFMKAFY